MNALFLFLLKAACINALMLGFYHFAIRQGQNLKLMRFVLLLSIVLPLLLPVLPKVILYSESSTLPVYVFTLPAVSNEVVISAEHNNQLLPLIQNTIYLALVVFLLSGTVISILSVLRKYKLAYEKPTPYGKVLIDNSSKSPYSFFRWVFFSEESLLHPAAQWLLRHEFSHVKHGHSFDRLLSAIFRAIFWFSPFAHFNHKLLAEVHEYQADADAIESYEHKTAYSNLLVSFAGSSEPNEMINPFSAHLKKRMMMMNNLKPGKLSFIRIATGLIAIGAVTFFSAMVSPIAENATQTEQITGTIPTDDTSKKENVTPKKVKDTEQVFTVVENTPKYPGGETARIAYMQKAITYPEKAKKEKIEGTVYVTFIVETDGTISNASVLRGIGGGCDEMALSAVQHMPAWEPGTQRGKAVRVQYNMPVSFKLGEDKKVDAASSKPLLKPAETKDDVFVVVEVAPQFPGGAEAQQAYFNQNIVYPADAKAKGIQGTVYVNFIIETDGSVSHAKVLRGVSPLLDNEALRVIQNMPRWTPGSQRGEPVRVSFNLPIKFSLGEKKTEK